MSEQSPQVESSRNQLVHLVRMLLVGAVLFAAAAGGGLWLAQNSSAGSPAESSHSNP